MEESGDLPPDPEKDVGGPTGRRGRSQLLQRAGSWGRSMGLNGI